MHNRIYIIPLLISLAAFPALSEEVPPPVVPSHEKEIFDMWLAKGYTAAGQRAAYTCGMCHSFDEGGPDTPAPDLWDIVGSPRARSTHFQYSPALLAMRNQRWTYEALDAFLRNPQQFAPGTRMAVAGVSDPRVRASLVAWLRRLSAHPLPLPPPPKQ